MEMQHTQCTGLHVDKQTTNRLARCMKKRHKRVRLPRGAAPPHASSGRTQWCCGRGGGVGGGCLRPCGPWEPFHRLYVFVRHITRLPQGEAFIHPFHRLSHRGERVNTGHGIRRGFSRGDSKKNHPTPEQSLSQNSRRRSLFCTMQCLVARCCSSRRCVVPLSTPRQTVSCFSYVAIFATIYSPYMYAIQRGHR